MSSGASLYDDTIIETIQKTQEELRKLQFRLNFDFRVFDRIETLENIVSKIENEVRYNNRLLQNCSNTSDSTPNYNREVKESTMMTLNEVVQHYAFMHSKNNDTCKCSNGAIINSMNAVAGCRNVSALAYAFYCKQYTLMKPHFIDGWLVSLTNTPLLLKDDSRATSVDVSFTGPMKCFSHNVQNGSCVWQCDANKKPLQILEYSSHYYTHSAIEVVLNDGEKVIVDWNIGQFQNLDEGQFVFVIQC